MTRIVWFSRHVPTRRQRAELESIFGHDLELTHDSHAFDTADDVVARYKMSGAAEMVVVAPDAVIRAIVRRGIHPLWARMELCSRLHPQCEVTIQPRAGKPRHYRHVSFERVLKADFDTEPLASLAELPSLSFADSTIKTNPEVKPSQPSVPIDNPDEVGIALVEV